MGERMKRCMCAAVLFRVYIYLVLYVYTKSFVDDWVGSVKDTGLYKEKPGCLIHICELLENMNE